MQKSIIVENLSKNYFNKEAVKEISFITKDSQKFVLSETKEPLVFTAENDTEVSLCGCKESNNAPFWKVTPKSNKIFSLSVEDEFTISLPSILIEPLFGVNKPIIHLNKTDMNVDAYSNTPHAEDRRYNRLFQRSDHYNFYKKGIPCIFFFTGIHDDYHRPSDEIDKLNFDGIQKIADLVDSIVIDFSSNNRLKFQEITD